MAQFTWTLKGRLLVRTQFQQLADADGLKDDLAGVVPLAGVRVRVRAKETKLDPTGFGEWGEDVTDADGHFQFSKQKDGSKRFFQVQVMFRDPDLLKIYPANDGVLSKACDLVTDLIPGGPVVRVVTELQEDLIEAALGAVSRVTFDVDWITVYEDRKNEDKQDNGTVDFGDLIFQSPGGEELGGTIQRRHADLWALSKKLINKLADFGSGLGFVEKKPIAIKYPHKSPLIGDRIEQAYADPLNDVVFLIQNSQRDSFDLETAMHELMHLWTYQHCSGENRLAWQLILHGSTHDGRQGKTWTAFHEAWAEFAKTELHRQMFGAGATYYGSEKYLRAPLSRAWLKSQGIRELSEMDHYEWGWMSTFNLLVYNRVTQLDMNTAEDYATPTLTPFMARQPDLSFADLLGVFLPHGSGAFRTEMTPDQMTIPTYLARLSASIPDRFTPDHVAAYLAILDPAGTGQPGDLLKLTATPGPIHRNPADLKDVHVLSL
ncbi:MAG: hypothetical protein U1E63_11465 [Burkholderiales bacterium]